MSLAPVGRPEWGFNHAASTMPLQPRPWPSCSQRDHQAPLRLRAGMRGARGHHHRIHRPGKRRGEQRDSRGGAVPAHRGRISRRGEGRRAFAQLLPCAAARSSTRPPPLTTAEACLGPGPDPAWRPGRGQLQAQAGRRPAGWRQPGPAHPALQEGRRACSGTTPRRRRRGSGRI